MINGNKKGKVGEREWRDRLRAHGYTDARRGQQFSGSNESPDVVCPSLDFLHFEVKRVQNLNVSNAMAQANHDIGDSKKMPIVAHRKNGESWLVTMADEDFFRLLRAYVFAYQGAE
jgi:Holliday junction resolvase